MKERMIRVSDDILIKLREILPEFKDESDANLVRVALRKFLNENEKQSMLRNPLYGRQDYALPEELRRKIEAELNEKQRR